MLTESSPKLLHGPAPWPFVHLTGARPWIVEVICALGGHDLMLHVEHGKRICLRCTDCGHETPGWELN